MATLTDPAGDTAGVLRRCGLNVLARLNSAAEIEATLPAFLAAVQTGRAPLAAPDAVCDASRTARSEAFAAMLDGVLERGVERA